MRVVQTFWTCGNDPLKNSFGWLSPEYNLMAWTLSCLCLKENYEEVVLYTDSLGYSVLIDTLRLPYSEVIVAYDDISCHKKLWALPKLMTYAAQKVPFIHVDGDVFLRARLSPEVAASDLIVQNQERGTAYYKHMTDKIKKQVDQIPGYLLEELEKESISSYNAGVLGGNDLDFIGEYCRTAFRFVEENKLNESEVVSTGYNILYEQILLYVLSNREPLKKVGTVVPEIIRDKGYSSKQFCDFSAFSTTKPFMHIIGGHKRKEPICAGLKQVLYKNYPDYFFRIMNLFPQPERWNKDLEISKKLVSYELFKQEAFQGWSRIEDEQYMDIEKRLREYPAFLSASRREKDGFVIKRNPFIAMYEDSREWPEPMRNSFRQKVQSVFYKDGFDIVCVPLPFFNAFKEVPIDDYGYNILILLEEDMSFRQLMKELRMTVEDPEIRKKNRLFYDIVCSRLEYLFRNQVIYI